MLLCGTGIYAQKKTFVREYTYRASEADSKLSARAIASTEIRKLMLREVGEFLISERTGKLTETSQEYYEKIEAITAGIVEMKTIDEQWNGVTYYIKAEMTVDPADLERRIAEVFSNKEKTKELEEASKRVKDAEAEIETLKKELAKTSNKNNVELQAAYKYQTGILESNEYITRGNIALNNGWNEDAIKEYNKAYAQMPDNAATYLLMGGIYGKVHTKEGCRLAIKCYEKFFETNPNSTEVWILAGNICLYCDRNVYGYDCSSEKYYEKAIHYYRNVIMGNPDNADAYDKLAAISYALGKRGEAETYSNKAKEIRKEERRHSIYKLSGQVTDINGKPLSSVSVSITADNGSTQSTLTDAGGQYVFSAAGTGNITFSHPKFSTKDEYFSGYNTDISVIMEKPYNQRRSKTNGGLFLSYIYDSNPVKNASIMYGIGLFNCGKNNTRLGWYVSFRANSSFFSNTFTTSTSMQSKYVSSFVFNAGVILKLFGPVALYAGPGIGYSSAGSKTYDYEINDFQEENKTEWYFNPETGIMLNFSHGSLFGGLKYPLPSNDKYEKLLYMVGAGFNIGRKR